MDCSKVSPLLQDYVEKALDPSACDDVRRHVESCEACSREAQAYGVLFTALDAEPAPRLPRDLTASIMAYVLKKRRYSIFGLPVPSWRASDFALVAASLLLCLAFSYQLIQGHSDTIADAASSLWEAAASIEPDLELPSLSREFGGLQLDIAGLAVAASEEMASAFQSFGGMGDYVSIPAGAVLPFLVLSAALMFIGNLVCLSTSTRRAR